VALIAQGGEQRAETGGEFIVAQGEVGRQPWIVYGLMRTRDAVSPIAASQVGVTLTAFILVYSLLGAVAFYLMAKFARQGPEPAPATADSGEVAS
jgi:cytochrome bd-type quinol oxidase subunit 1